VVKEWWREIRTGPTRREKKHRRRIIAGITVVLLVLMVLLVRFSYRVYGVEIFVDLSSGDVRRVTYVHGLEARTGIYPTRFSQRARALGLVTEKARWRFAIAASLLWQTYSDDSMLLHDTVMLAGDVADANLPPEKEKEFYCDAVKAMKSGGQEGLRQLARVTERVVNFKYAQQEAEKQSE
jgi:hypothetical protein